MAVDLRHEPDVTIVLVSIPASVVELTTRACYQFTLRQSNDIAYEEANGYTAGADAMTYATLGPEASEQVLEIGAGTSGTSPTAALGQSDKTGCHH